MLAPNPSQNLKSQNPVRGNPLFKFSLFRSCSNERRRVPNALPITGTVARQPDPSPPANLGWSVIPNTVSPAAPDNDKNVRVDVLLHLHGFGAGYRELKPGESDYAGVLKPGELRDVDLYQMEQQLLSHVKTSKQLLIAVLPQGSGSVEFWGPQLQQQRLLKEVFDKLVPIFLPKGSDSRPRDCVGTQRRRPHSVGNRQTKLDGEDRRVSVAMPSNYVCKERVPVIKDGKPVVDKCTEHQKPNAKTIYVSMDNLLR